VLYLDHAATSPVRPEVLEAMRPYLTEVFGNPSSHHTTGEAAASALDDARARVAAALGVRTGDVVFTAGGTEANNLAVKGITLAALARDRRHLVVSPIEHESILESAEYLRRFHGVPVTQVVVDSLGRISPEALSAALRDDTALVSLGHANNEIGTVQDLAALSAVTRAAGVPLHVDAVQSAGWLDLRELGADERRVRRIRREVVGEAAFAGQQPLVLPALDALAEQARGHRASLSAAARTALTIPT